jgi:hypothetical protein
MRTRFFSSQELNPRKNGRRISFMSHDLASTLTLPTPQNSLFAGRCS